MRFLCRKYRNVTVNSVKIPYGILGKNSKDILMPRLKFLFALSALILSSLACVTLFGKKSASAGMMPGMAIPPTATPEALSCPLITDKIVDQNVTMDLSNQLPLDMFSSSIDNGDGMIYLVTYTVDGNEIRDPSFEEDVPADLVDEQNNTVLHQKLWEYFSTLIPLEARPTLAEFSIMTDGSDDILAAVEQTYDDPNHWTLEVDIADVSDYYYLTFTLVHEYAHLLTLGPDQVPPSLAVFNNPDDNDLYLQEVSACATFFPGEGCSNPDSYMNAFYDQFWTDIYDEWNTINAEEDEDLYYEKLDDFYSKYEDQFLTDYSATHPAEDLAEAFGFFVFADKPDGSNIAEQKILFFYQYPELVELRTKIRNNVCLNFPQ